MANVCPIKVSTSGLPGRECPNCGFTGWCLPANLTLHELKQFNSHVVHSRLVKRGEFICSAGAALTSLFVIRSGSLKTSIADSEGRDQITGFSMTGELIGMDAISESRYQCDTIALEDSYLCGIPYADFERLTREIPALQRHFHRAMGTEIARDHGIMLLLGAMNAEERVAIFLLNLSKRFAARGYSGTVFRMTMTRQEIGSYLGLKLETVSRAFSHFKNIGFIAIDGKTIEIRSVEQLEETFGVYGTRRSLPRRAISGAH